MFGQSVKDPNGEKLLVQKATGWMTNDDDIAKAVGVRCDGEHSHTHLIGGIASDTERYPPKLVKAILLALRQSMRKAGRGEALGVAGAMRQPTVAAIEIGPVLEEPSLAESPPQTGELKEAWDRATGLPLDPVLVTKAR